MKKRIFSFVILVVTLVAIIAFGAPSIKNNSRTGMEFNGGFDILYEVKSEDAELSSKDFAKTAAEGIEKRLDIANIIDPIVSIEGNKYVRVTVSASSQLVADDIRSIIENNAEISFRDYQNNLLATGEEILEEVGATLTDEVDSYGHPIIELNIKDTELLAEITESVSSLEDQHLVVWLGFEEGDDYANLETDASVAKKIIYNATVSSKLDTETITVTGSFTKSMAESTVALINSGTLNYELDVLQISTVNSQTASKSFNKVLIASLIAIVIVVAALCAYYKFGGLVSSISLLFNLFLSLILFVSMKGIINQQTIAALIVVIGISVDAIVILLERIKNELYNGKTLEKALNEGYKKSVSSIIDANIVILIMSLVMYFLGSGVANFALMLSLSSVCSLLVMTLLNKLLLSFMIKLNVSPNSLGAKKAYLENKDLYINRIKFEPFKSSKKQLLGLGLFSTVAIIVMLVLQLTMGSMFNYNNTINKNSSITIISTDSYFTDDAHVKEFFAQEGLNLEIKKISISEINVEETTKYKVYVTTNSSVTAVEKELTNKIIEVFGENKEYDERYELYINDINPKATSTSLLSALYTTGIGLLIVGIYLAFRYRYSYAISAIISTIVSVVLTALFLGLTRIKIGSDAVIAIFAIAVYGLNTLVVMFSRLKEMLVVDKTRKYISNEERHEAVNKAINASLSRIVLTTISIIAISIVLLCFASVSNYSFYISLIIGIVFSSYSAIVISNLVWILFEKRSDKKKRTFKPKNNNSKFKELEEHVFIGIND